MTEYKTLTPWDFRRLPVEMRFLAKIEYAENGCWLWRGCIRKPWGYGQMSINNKPVWAHRWSYEHYNGSIPEGHVVMHSCDTPACVNPKHLSTGTHEENMKDMYSKGRNNTFGRKGPGTHRRADPNWIDPRRKTHASGDCRATVGTAINKIQVTTDATKITCKTCLRDTKIQQATRGEDK